MGEVKIKSENLFDVTTVTNVYLDVQGVEHSSEKSRTSDYIPVTANTLYTLGMTGVSSSLNLTAYCFYDSNKEFLSFGTYQPSTIGNIVSITTPNNCAYFRFTYNYLRNLVEFVSGVYNTFPPYFLNRPAHQFTNGEWIDIPTHHFINGRWQGELTSQSPLKFWADGEMLDWRIEGKTSENLVESFRTTQRVEQYRICLLSKFNIKPSTSYTISFIMEEGVKAYFNEYLFTPYKGFTGTGQRQVFNITTKADIGKNASTWVTEYGWILCKNSVNNEKPCNFREVMILEGTYTASTIPPYEPYGGVGDWDETEQKYKIPVTVRGDNLYSSAWKQGFWAYDTGSGWGTDSKYVRTAKMPCEGNTKYEFVCSLPDGSKDYGFVFWDANGNYIGNIHSSDVQNTPVKYSATSPANAKMMAINIARYSDGERHPADILSFDLYELHETNLYTDHQLMDGDSIDYTTTETTIPLATGNNTLTVDTAVKPKSVFVKFEG